MSKFYCDYATTNPIDAAYHNTEYGFPSQDETILMERLALEIMQAGLTWHLILKRRPLMVKAFDDFKVDKIAHYDQAKIDELLLNPDIIRNRLKVNAIIHNANIVKDMRQQYGGFSKWLDDHHPKTLDEWVKLFKKTFKFTGPEITNEFLMSLGYLDGAHRADCPQYQQILKLSPPWAQ